MMGYQRQAALSMASDSTDYPRQSWMVSVATDDTSSLESSQVDSIEELLGKAEEGGQSSLWAEDFQPETLPPGTLITTRTLQQQQNHIQALPINFMLATSFFLRHRLETFSNNVELIQSEGRRSIIEGIQQEETFACFLRARLDTFKANMRLIVGLTSDEDDEEEKVPREESPGLTYL